MCTKLTDFYPIICWKTLQKARKPSAIIINVPAEIVQGTHYEQNLEPPKIDQTFSIYTEYLTKFRLDAFSDIHGH